MFSFDLSDLAKKSPWKRRAGGALVVCVPLDLRLPGDGRKEQHRAPSPRQRREGETSESSCGIKRTTQHKFFFGTRVQVKLGP